MMSKTVRENEFKMYSVMCKLIDICNAGQKEAREISDAKNLSLQKVSFMKNFCTIKMKVCQGMGHTWLIKNLIAERFDHLSILFYNQRMVSQFQSSHKITKDKFPNIEFGSTFQKEWEIGEDTEALIIDNASFISEKRLSNIFEFWADHCWYVPHKSFFVILLD